MPTYMFQGCYTPASIASLVHMPEDRSAVVSALITDLGGKLEGFWLSFGDHDFVGIAQLPDSHAAAAFSLAASAGGGVHHLKTIELLSWAEGIKALQLAGGVKYRSPTTTAG